MPNLTMNEAALLLAVARITPEPVTRTLSRWLALRPALAVPTARERAFLCRLSARNRLRRR